LFKLKKTLAGLRGSGSDVRYVWWSGGQFVAHSARVYCVGSWCAACHAVGSWLHCTAVCCIVLRCVAEVRSEL